MALSSLSPTIKNWLPDSFLGPKWRVARGRVTQYGDNVPFDDEAMFVLLCFGKGEKKM